jgi:hypothetical protein
MRDIWQTTNLKHGADCSMATNPVRLKSSGIKKMIDTALWKQGLGIVAATRHEFKELHGFRKFYKTHAENKMKTIDVEKLMGHKSREFPMSDHYHRPEEIAQRYLEAVPDLTINKPEGTEKLQDLIVEEDLRKDMEAVFRITKGIGKIFFKVSVHLGMRVAEIEFCGITPQKGVTMVSTGKGRILKEA